MLLVDASKCIVCTCHLKDSPLIHIIDMIQLSHWSREGIAQGDYPFGHGHACFGIHSFYLTSSQAGLVHTSTGRRLIQLREWSQDGPPYFVNASKTWLVCKKEYFPAKTIFQDIGISINSQRDLCCPWRNFFY